MLDPSQFSPNEAWILFQLNDAPVCTEADGDFNVVCLMDAASCLILGMEFAAAQSFEISLGVAKQLFEAGLVKGQGLPSQLLVSANQPAGHFVTLAEDSGLKVSVVADLQLLPFVSEARKGFQAHVSGTRMQ